MWCSEFIYVLCSAIVWAYLLIQQVACFSTFSVVLVRGIVVCLSAPTYVALLLGDVGLE